VTAAMLEDLAELVTCESPSSDLAAVAQSAKVVAMVGERRLGVAPEVLVLEGRTHLRWRFGTGDRVLLLGHHDTVWPLGSLAEHPWRVVDGIAYGPGCFDMLAGLVQLFHAVAALDDPSGVAILVTGDEELGAPSSRGLVEDEARRAGIALVLEASADDGALKTARSGVSQYDVQVRGRASHAGLEPHAGVNASVELAHVVLALAALDEGPGRSTVTPTQAVSGTSANTVPALATLAVDVRSPNAADQERIDEQVRVLRPTLPGASLEVVRRTSHPPLEPQASSALFDLARQVATDHGLPPLTGVGVGGASDGNIAAGAGALTLDGLGAVGGNAHAPGEHVVVSAMPERSLLLRGMVDRILLGWSAPMNPDTPDGGDRR
jgi:glutamate carboxypeptidase